MSDTDKEAVVSTPVDQLAGIGPATASSLQKAGIQHLWDLLLLLPIRYEDRTRLTPTREWAIHQWAQIEGVVVRHQPLPGRRIQHILQLQTDNTYLFCRFLNYDKWSHTLPTVGQQIRVFGQLRRTMQGEWEMLHPQITRLNTAKPTPLAEHLTAVYPSIGQVKQGNLRKAIHQAIERLQSDVHHVDFITHTDPPLTLLQAFEQIHRPHPGHAISLLTGHHPAIQRLAYEELTAYQLLNIDAQHTLKQYHAPQLMNTHHLTEQLIQQLGFTLTQAQAQAWEEIQQDLKQSHPMHRLLQGDVGSGKTVLAALASTRAVECGYQAAVMAPTDILAQQLFHSLHQWLSPLGIQCLKLSANTKANERRQALLTIADGRSQVVVGTHALFQDQVQYHNLGLVIVDEQHRFGVEQRLALKHKGRQDLKLPHLMLMTATPIPRTLAMTLYGDLSVSTLRERPPGRQDIDTAVISETRREQVADRLAHACQQGAQAYWVCPFIMESETTDAQNVTDTARWLSSRFPMIRIGLIHGQLSATEKETQMNAFKAGMLHLLVATTVIEVGVNVPNATLMVIDNAERYGLAQLHQLRGRVGRGDKKSNCMLLYRSPLSETGQARLDAIRQHQDGFALAELDLSLRGPGDVLSTQQTGIHAWRVADLVRDQALHQPARDSATQIYQQQPKLAQQLIKRWFQHRLHYREA